MIKVQFSQLYNYILKTITDKKEELTMNKFNALKLVQFIVIIGIVLSGGLYFNNLKKQNIIEKQRLQAVHEEEVKKLEEVNQKHVQELVHYEIKLEDRNEKIETLVNENYDLREIVKSSRGESSEWEKFGVSFYDLGEKSCGKKKSHPEYGITSSGFNLKGLDWESARTIATDPKIIPTGSEVMIKFFDDKYEFLNGIYTARDRGSAIKGNKIDLYIGEDCYNECMDLGITEAYIQVLK